jgi:iron complex outermembrane receptor protein
MRLHNNNHPAFSIHRLAAAVVALSTLGSQPLIAGVLEEVVVTAQKREQSLQDVGIAVSAFTGDQLDALGFNNSSDIAMLTPGVHVGGNLAGQNLQFTIRGVAQNDFSDHTESPVAVYIDETYVAMAQGQRFAMFDLERVEVLKGPQGTLFGRNATGGLAHFVTRKPTEEVDGYVELEYGDYDRMRLEGAVGGALSESVWGRISAQGTEQDSYLDNDYNADGPGVIAANIDPLMPAADDFGAEENKAVRAQLLFKLSEDAELLLSGNWADSTLSTSPYQSEATMAVLDDQGRQIDAVHLPGADITGYKDPDGIGLDHTSGNFSIDDLNTMETRGISAKLNWDLGFGELIAISDYKDYDKLMGMDVDSAPMNQLTVWFGAEVEQYTQEIRLQGETQNLRWVTGGFYMHAEYDIAQGFKAGNNSNLLLPITAEQEGDYPAFAQQETDNLSLFAQFDYDLSDTLLLTAGLRVMQEEKDYDYALDIVVYGPGAVPADRWATGLNIGHYGDLVPGHPDTHFSDDTSDTLWTGKIQLDWTPTSDLLVYAGINRGVKAGGFNAPIDFGGAQRSPGGYEYAYDEEVLMAYEVGFKSTLFEGSTRINGSVYYYDYSDYQGYVFAGVSGNVVNYDSTVAGAEFELITTPADGLDLMLTASYIDATVDDVEVAPGLYRDREPSYVPPLQVSGLARYAWDAFGGELALQAEFSYSDRFYYTLRNYTSHQLDSYTTGNLRLSYVTEDSKWEVDAFVENVTDEEYGIMGFDISLFCGCSEVAAGTPRWWGVSVRRNL